MRLFVLFILIGISAGFSAASAQNSGGGGRGVPSISVRSPDQGKFRTTALTALGWRLGVRSDSLGAATFWEAAAKVDAAGLAFVEGIATQSVGPEIPRPLD